MDAAHQKAVQQGQMVAATHKMAYSSLPAQDRQGNMTTLDQVSVPQGTHPLNDAAGHALGYQDTTGANHWFPKGQ
jgi:hypothetical protein